MGKPRYTVTLEQDPDPADEDRIREGLRAFNRAQIQQDAGDNYRHLCFFVRANDGTVLGGLLGDCYWGWLAIRFVWLHEDLRGQGFGRDLVLMAEAEAIKFGCRWSYLDTMSFQAPGFYEQLGYDVVAVLEDFPPGHQKVILKKQLISP